MCKTVIAIGNRMMMDDGIAICIAESIKKQLEENNIKVIIGETDVDYCFSVLNSYDEFYIIDSMYLDNIPGNIIVEPLKDINEEKKFNHSPHSFSIIDMIKMYGLNIKGFFVGIEACEISFGSRLSNALNEKFESLCQNVLNIITQQV